MALKVCCCIVLENYSIEKDASILVLNCSVHYICLSLTSIIAHAHDILIDLLVPRFLGTLVIILIILPTNTRQTPYCYASIWPCSYHLSNCSWHVTLWIHLELRLCPSIAISVDIDGSPANTFLLLLLDEISKILHLLRIHLLLLLIVFIWLIHLMKLNGLLLCLLLFSLIQFSLLILNLRLGRLLML